MSVWLNKISKRFICVYKETFTTPALFLPTNIQQIRDGKKRFLCVYKEMFTTPALFLPTNIGQIRDGKKRFRKDFPVCMFMYIG